jgi:hypothetical protein
VGSSSQGGGHFDILSDEEETKEEKQPDVEEETDEEDKPFIEFIDCCRPRGEHYYDGILHHASVSVDVDVVVAFAAKGNGILRVLPEEANFSTLRCTSMAKETRIKLADILEVDETLPSVMRDIEKLPGWGIRHEV